MSEALSWDDEPLEPPEPRPYIPTVMDAEVWPDDVAAWACSVTAGSAVLIPLTAVDPRRLSHAGLVNYIDAWEKHCSWAQARQYRGLAEFDDDTATPGLPGEQGKDWGPRRGGLRAAAVVRHRREPAHPGPGARPAVAIHAGPAGGRGDQHASLPQPGRSDHVPR